jgi:hypothetical protein
MTDAERQRRHRDKLRVEKGLCLTQRELHLIAWTQWALNHAPDATIAERDALIWKTMTGLTEAERAQVEHMWPTFEYEIVLKPGAGAKRTKATARPS